MHVLNYFIQFQLAPFSEITNLIFLIKSTVAPLNLKIISREFLGQLLINTTDFLEKLWNILAIGFVKTLFQHFLCILSISLAVLQTQVIFSSM